MALRNGFRRPSELPLKHSVRIRGSTGKDLEYVPVLNDFTGTIAPENIDCGIVVASWPDLPAVNDNQVTLGHDAFYLHMFARKLACHSLEVGNKPCSATFDMRIVLNVIIADIPFHGLARPTFVEHQIVESDNIRLVLLKLARLSLLQESHSPAWVRRNQRMAPQPLTMPSCFCMMDTAL